jgi:hypothetical protein
MDARNSWGRSAASPSTEGYRGSSIAQATPGRSTYSSPGVRRSESPASRYSIPSTRRSESPASRYSIPSTRRLESPTSNYSTPSARRLESPASSYSIPSARRLESPASGGFRSMDRSNARSWGAAPGAGMRMSSPQIMRAPSRSFSTGASRLGSAPRSSGSSRGAGPQGRSRR